MRSRLEQHYFGVVIETLRARYRYVNPHQVPRIEKIVLNSSVSAGLPDQKQALDDVKNEMAKITGQRPIETRSRRSIANFKLRKGMGIGAKVTLRGSKMFEFLERLLKMALPRIRDFRGVSTRAFDGRGNYTLGITDQSIFPEIELDKIRRNVGFDVTIVTTAVTDEEAKSLLDALGMPFVDRSKRH